MVDFDEPFTGTAALAAGAVTRYQLAHHFVKLHRNVYVAPGIVATALLRAKATWLWAGSTGALAGVSAAAVHGTRWLDPKLPAEIIRPGKLRSTPGIVVHNISEAETCVVAGITVTTPARTGFDLARRDDLDRCIENLDSLCNATGLKISEIEAVAAQHKGARNLVSMRKVLDLADGGAASPPETHTRLLLVRAGLPRPETQIEIFDDSGFVARADMGWKQWMVLVEYDGAQHWTDRVQRTLDIDRYALLPELGWTVIRVGADLLYRRPDVLVERVRRALRRAGASV
jgi:enamine deaminase RidA (YjgF/YER057c/UK114 family)